MNKTDKFFIGILTVFVILLTGVIAGNIIISLQVVPIKTAKIDTASQEDIPSLLPKGKSEIKTTESRVDISQIKRQIEKAGLTPTEARYWKEVD